MTSISYLPLAHIFERVVQQTIFFYGGRIGFFSGDIKRLPSDLKALKPSVLPSVPRLINRIYQRVASQVGRSKFKSKMVEIGLRVCRYSDLNQKLRLNPVLTPFLSKSKRTLKNLSSETMVHGIGLRSERFVRLLAAMSWL